MGTKKKESVVAANLQIGAFSSPADGLNAPAMRLAADAGHGEVTIEYWFNGAAQMDETIASLTALREAFYGKP